MRIPRPNIRLPKLHPLSWCVAGMMLVFVLLVQVAGVEVPIAEQSLLERDGTYYCWGPPPDNGLPIVVLEYEHGWPIEWGRRAIGYGAPPWRSVETVTVNNMPMANYDWKFSVYGYSISWTTSLAWPLMWDCWQWSISGLLVNLFVSMLLVGIPIAICEIWIQRRGGLWRLRIVDLIVATAFVAAMFALWRWDKADRKQELEFLSQGSLTVTPSGAKGGDFGPEFYSSYAGPRWLSSLAGNSESLPFLHRITYARSFGDCDSERRLQYIRNLRYLDLICWRQLPTMEEAKEAAGLSRLRSIYLNDNDRASETTPSATVEVFKQIAKSSTVEYVYIQSRFIAIDDLTPLLDATSLRMLAVVSQNISNEEIQELNDKYPAIVIK